MIKAIALAGDILLEARDHVGPTSILRGDNAKSHIAFASAVTLRYSDSPKEQQGVVTIKNENTSEEITTNPSDEQSYNRFRI